MREFKRILVIRTDRIGDVVLTTPFFKALRKHFPDAYIAALLAPSTRDILYRNPHIDAIMVDDKRGAHRGVSGFAHLVGQLRRERFECVFNLHTKHRTNLLSSISGIPYRSGYRDAKAGFLLSHPLPDRRIVGDRHEAQLCLDLLGPLGIEEQASGDDLYVGLKTDAVEWADRFWREQEISPMDPVVAIHAGGSDPSKRWPESRFAELIAQLRGIYPSLHILLLGTDPVPLITRALPDSTGARVLDMTGQTNLACSIALLKRCRMLVSNDSGPVHLAAALQLPVVSIFTRNQPGINPTRWGPLGTRSRVVAVPEDNRPDFSDGHDFEPDYLEILSVKRVFEAVDAVYKLC